MSVIITPALVNMTFYSVVSQLNPLNDDHQSRKIIYRISLQFSFRYMNGCWVLSVFNSVPTDLISVIRFR